MGEHDSRTRERSERAGALPERERGVWGGDALRPRPCAEPQANDRSLARPPWVPSSARSSRRPLKGCTSLP